MVLQDEYQGLEDYIVLLTVTILEPKRRVAIHWSFVLYMLLQLPLPPHSQQPLSVYYSLREHCHSEDVRLAQYEGYTFHPCTQKQTLSQWWPHSQPGNWSGTVWCSHLCLDMDSLGSESRDDKVLGTQRYPSTTSPMKTNSESNPGGWRSCIHLICNILAGCVVCMHVQIDVSTLWGKPAQVHVARAYPLKSTTKSFVYG